MGVTGLLPHLQGAQEKTTLAKYKGKKLAVDTYGWLHRGLISCAQDLCTEAPTRAYVTSVMRKIDMVRHFGAEPVLVFDGAPLPTKEGTHAERRARRETARDAAHVALARGDKKRAWKEFMRAAAVTPEMAKSVMVELDRAHVQYVVAPYEADPQMVYLERTGAVDAILSEDSDLFVFGCHTLVTKLNDYGECVELSRDRLACVPRMQLHMFTPAQWRLVAILSGCDYTKGVPGVGIKTAFSMVSRLNVEHASLERVVALLRAEGRAISTEFIQEATRADLAFQYQKVFDLATNAVTTLYEIEPDADIDMDALELCCGRTLAPDVHAGICRGRLHPSSHEVLISREQSLTAPRSHSVDSAVAAAVSASASATGSKKNAASSASQSFSCTPSITSFFKKDTSQTLKVAAATISTVTNQTTGPLKRPSEDRTQLSPNSKKLRRLKNPSSGMAAAVAVQSKFFTSVHTALSPAPASITRPKPNDEDFGFCTGDSDIPDNSSSPVRNAAATKANEAGALTDDDTDPDADTDADAGSKANSANPMQSRVSVETSVDSDADEGYDDEIDESPIKREKIGLSWRQQFSMCEDQESRTKSAVLFMKKKAEKAGVANTRPSSRRMTVVSSEVEDKSRSDSPEIPSSPRTPNDTVLETTVSETGSPIKASPKTFIADSEDDLGLSPQHATCLVPRRSPRLSLSRFAFTGN